MFPLFYCLYKLLALSMAKAPEEWREERLALCARVEQGGIFENVPPMVFCFFFQKKRRDITSTNT